ncbi:hypothetical protein ABZ023_32825 [Streptomyces sp. NPDC006367]|uniref:hypothetical protein n=1 Tax=unclassified Streptomyces TaxID=2593676 RepID=UPI0033AB9DD7
MSALLWLLIPFLTGMVASVWAWSAGRRDPGPPDRDTWEDLDRYRRLRTALSGTSAATRREGRAGTGTGLVTAAPPA